MEASLIGTDTRMIDLAHIVDNLPDEDKAIFHRIFKVLTSEGGLQIPANMHSWIEQQFGSVEAVARQRVVRVVNLATFEDALFNPIRSMRPMDVRNGVDLNEVVSSGGSDPLDSPLEGTPADVFGRIEGEHSITAGNVAKIDGFSGLVIFKNYNPLHFSREEIADYLDVGLRWAREANRVDPAAKYYFFLWNCLWRSGASLLHGHAQVAVSRFMHYGKIEHLRRSALLYREENRVNYFEDLVKVHRALGLTIERGDTVVMPYLTPTKERETILIAPELSRDLKDSVYEVLSCLRDVMGVTSFNLALYLPPIGESEEDWSGFPAMVRIVDRGGYSSRTSDMGAMEVYACPVVSSDPFQVARLLRESMSRP